MLRKRLLPMPLRQTLRTQQRLLLILLRPIKMKRHTPAFVAAGLMLAGCNSPDTASQAPAAQPAATTTQTAASTPTPTVEPSAEIGKMIFRRCTSCHTIEAGGSNGIGPNLHGVVGRPVASVAGFSYSNAMRAKGGIWDEATLEHYLEQPMKAIPGTRMAFAGIIDAADRKSIYLYLKSAGE
jgi:cytochrome c